MHAAAAAAGGQTPPAAAPPSASLPAAGLLPQVEDPKRALLVYGNKTSQVIKDVMTDLQKIKGVRRCRYLVPQKCSLGAWPAVASRRGCLLPGARHFAMQATCPACPCTCCLLHGCPPPLLLAAD